MGVLVTSLVVVALLGLLAVACFWWLPPLHPAVLWTGTWAVAVLFFTLDLLPYRELSALTAFLVCAAGAAFVLGTLAGERAVRIPARRLPSRDLAVIRPAAVVTTSVAGLLLVAFLAQSVVSHGLRPTLVSSPTVRAAIEAGDFVVTIKYVYAALAAAVLSAAAAAGAGPRGRSLRWVLVAAACVASIYFTTSRSTIVTGMIAAVVAYVLASDYRLTRARFIAGVAVVALAGLGVFLVGGRAIGKTFENNPPLQAVPSVFRDYGAISELALPYQYVSAPVAAFDVQVDASTTWGTAHGCAALSEACRILARLGADVDGVDRVRPFTRAPLPWNTYTALDVPLLDGGLALAVPIVALVGLVVGAVWGFARVRSAEGVLVYALLAPAVVSAPGSFNFTAPHIVGAALMVLATCIGARTVQRVRGARSAVASEA